MSCWGAAIDIAWGFTNTAKPTAQDVFAERVNPDNPDQYLTPTGWASVRAKRRRSSWVKGGAEQTFTPALDPARSGPARRL